MTQHQGTGAGEQCPRSNTLPRSDICWIFTDFKHIELILLFFQIFDVWNLRDVQGSLKLLGAFSGTVGGFVSSRVPRCFLAYFSGPRNSRTPHIFWKKLSPDSDSLGFVGPIGPILTPNGPLGAMFGPKQNFEKIMIPPHLVKKHRDP